MVFLLFGLADLGQTCLILGQTSYYKGTKILECGARSIISYRSVRNFYELRELSCIMDLIK